ncbi:MAG: hypothetical protein IJ299_05755, partial [Oscillospiraceae bacterium]|nr:hypothetical protein [Oscillospiraceae bacterium]
MEELMRVCTVALVGAIAVSLLRRNVPEMSVLLTVALVAGMVFLASGAITGVIKLLYELAGS